ncbi:hypothetical protein H4V99_002558 [Cryobacterium sp. CG_9.6]|nr:hypothetical protein [Cryobacterium sp. CG_9.6]
MSGRHSGKGVLAAQTRAASVTGPHPAGGLSKRAGTTARPARTSAGSRHSFERAALGKTSATRANTCRERHVASTSEFGTPANGPRPRAASEHDRGIPAGDESHHPGRPTPRPRCSPAGRATFRHQEGTEPDRWRGAIETILRIASPAHLKGIAT